MSISTITTAVALTILGVEFEIDELVDICNHGMQSGVGGFIYTYELNELFEDNEEEILNYLDEEASNIYGDKTGFEMVAENKQVVNLDSFRTFAVWMYVESKAYNYLVEVEHPEFC